jgi:4,5-DOPA dioxygenase extradiol
VSELPVIFVAHGAPTLAADPDKGAELTRWASAIPLPTAILSVSAHWEQAPAHTGTEETRELIYDFSGFPPELYRLRYAAPGAPALAEEVRETLRGYGLATASAPQRGWDHGVWVPLLHLYPSAEIPVLQLSLPSGSGPQEIYDMGRALAPLRRRGVLLMASGVLVHNLRTVDYSEQAATPQWARAFDAWCVDRLVDGDHRALIEHQQAAPEFRRAHPTAEHFTPLLVAAGAASVEDLPVGFPVAGFEYGSLSRRCVQFG